MGWDGRVIHLLQLIRMVCPFKIIPLKKYYMKHILEKIVKNGRLAKDKYKSKLVIRLAFTKSLWEINTVFHYFAVKMENGW